jgi:hypothetical protein
MSDLQAARTQNFFQRIIEIVTEAETKNLHILESLNQPSQRQLIETLQNRVYANLEKTLPNINWRSRISLRRNVETKLIFMANSILKMTIMALLSSSWINGVPIKLQRNLYRGSH